MDHSTVSSPPLVPRETTRWRRLLQRFAATRRAKMIRTNAGNILFVRYFLFRLPGGGQVYLHHYLAPDDDRGPHDHPWEWATSLILAGGYIETRLVGFRNAIGSMGTLSLPVLKVVERKPGRLYRMTGQDFHRISRMRDGRKSSWSLFAHGPYRKTWGFLVQPVGPLCGLLQFEEGISSKDPGARQWWTTAPKGRVFHA